MKIWLQPIKSGNKQKSLANNLLHRKGGVTNLPMIFCLQKTYDACLGYADFPIGSQLHKKEKEFSS